LPYRSVTFSCACFSSGQSLFHACRVTRCATGYRCTIVQRSAQVFKNSILQKTICFKWDKSLN
jgi:hypothetical protein